jgi:hypothetical protein
MNVEPRRSGAHVDKNEKGQKGVFRVIFFRKLGFFALIAFFIGSISDVINTYASFVKPFQTQLYQKLRGSKTVEQVLPLDTEDSVQINTEVAPASEQAEHEAKAEPEQVLSLDTQDLLQINAEVAPTAEQAGQETKTEPHFCGECTWYNRISCHRRQRYLMRKYGLSEESSLANMLKEPQCQKSVA